MITTLIIGVQVQYTLTMHVSLFRLDASAYRSYDAYMKHTNSQSATWNPNTYTGSSERRSDTWRGCYYEIRPDSVTEVVKTQQFLVGISFEMMYSDYKSASHPRCMQMRNFIPIYYSETLSLFINGIIYPHDTW